MARRSQTFKQPIIKAKNDGTVQFNDLRTVQALDGNWIVLNKNGTISVHDEDGRELERYNIVIGSVISEADGGQVKKGETFVQWDPYNVPILTEKAGKIEFRDMIAGVTMKHEVDEATGLMGMVVIEHKEDLHPQIVIVDDKKEVARQLLDSRRRARRRRTKAESSRPARCWPRRRAKIAKTKDITGGLPRVAELFEARRPKDAAEIAKIDGIVDIGGTVRGKRKLIVKDPETGAEEEHLIPLNKHIIVFKGDFVKKGQQLTEGPVVPHEILEVCGPQELQEHLVNEVQEVYRLQGVEINDKHIEIIVRQMLRKVKITDPGDTALLWGDQVDKLDFEDENERVVEKGRQARRSRAGAARHHQGLARNRQLHLRGVLPGHDPRPHRSGHPGQGRSAPRLQGKRHHGSPHPGRHRLPGTSRDQARRKRRAGWRASDGRSRTATCDRLACIVGAVRRRS